MRRFRISSKTHPSARVAAQLVARNPTKSPQRLPAPRSAAKLVSEEITTTPVFSPVPPRPTQDHECFIEFYETIELKPGQERTYIFKYFMGDPPIATAFGVVWYETREDQEANTNPVTNMAILPDYEFIPRHPVPDPINVRDGQVTFITPENIPYLQLYPELILF